MFLLAVWGAVLAGPGCLPSRAIKETKVPREGRPVGGTVAVVYSYHYAINLGGLERLHPFDIHKYDRIYQRLVDEGLLRPQDVFVPHPVTEEEILLVHTPGFLKSLEDPANVARYLEAPIIKYAPRLAVEHGILSAFRWSAGGTVEAARLALGHGVAVNIGGGFHHAMPDHGEGFNIYNDLGIAIRVLQREGLIRRACVVDVDVHQGNGTATIFAGDDSVFTFSMQEEGIYPLPRAKSSLDVELPAGTGDEEFLRILGSHLPGVLDGTAPDARHERLPARSGRHAPDGPGARAPAGPDRPRPDIVLIQGGCDTLAGDPLAHLTMTSAGIVRRDAMIIDACRERHIPVVLTLGGGYSKDAWKAQFDSLARTIRQYGSTDRGPETGQDAPVLFGP